MENFIFCAMKSVSLFFEIWYKFSINEKGDITGIFLPSKNVFSIYR